jgi:hypothetical protein
MKNIIALFFLTLSLQLNAQWVCSFEDEMPQGVLQSTDKHFQISDNKPINGKRSLKHVFDNSKSGSDQILFPLPDIDFKACSVVWAFSLRHAYLPSSSNGWGIFLAASNDPSSLIPSKTNAFAIGVNLSGSNDLLSLFYSQTTKTEIVKSSNFNWEDEAGTEKAVNVRVTRSANGNWTIWAATQNTELKQVASFKDIRIPTGNYWGVFYKYSKEQDQKLWIDDMSVESYQSEIKRDTIKTYDVLISEMMPDPTPTKGLPDAEYVELYNRTDKNIDLEGFMFEVGKNKFVFPSYSLSSKSSVILTAEKNIGLFTGIPVLSVFSSSTTLSNAGAQLVLRNAEGKTIHAVEYTDDWFSGSSGGISVEMIDTENPCAGTENWKLSVATTGGTPGAENSVKVLNRDSISPQISSSYILKNNKLQLTFSEPVDSILASKVGEYWTNPSLEIAQVEVLPPYFKQANIQFVEPLQTAVLYQIGLNSNICDCAENKADTTTFYFGLAEQPQAGDVQFSEILFDADSTQQEFIEIHNVTSKLLDISGFMLLVNQDTSYLPDNLILLPDEYKAFSKNTEWMRICGNAENQKHWVEWPQIPNLLADGATLTLSDTAGNEIAQAAYNVLWHNALLNETKGRSLERINFNNSGLEASSWASSGSKFLCGTPGWAGITQTKENEKVSLNLSSEVLQYNYLPEVNICLNNLDVGSIVSIYIFDPKGNLCTKLIENDLANDSFCFSWTGKTAGGAMLSQGIYIVWARVFLASGNVSEYKKVITIVAY